MTRLRIALVANNIHFRGGMERYCAELTRSLCQDHDVHLFASEIEDVPLDRVTVHRVRTVKRPTLLLFLQYYAKSSALIKMRDFDIVHTIGGITARQNVVTAQYCQYAWGEAIAREPGAAEGINAYHRLMWRLSGLFEKKAIRDEGTLSISANSARTKDDLIKHYGADPAKIKVIYNGVDALRFTPDNRQYRGAIRERYGLPSDALVLLFVGEYKRKGLATVIRALGLLNDSRVHLLAVGRGDKPKYRAIAADSGVSGRVRLTDPTTDVEKVFGAVDAFVFPTLYEPFGMVITEAMASGLPVITSRKAGAAEIIADGESGLLIERPNDAQELASKLQPLLASAALRADIGREARRAASVHDWAQVASETLALYHETCGQDVSGAANKIPLNTQRGAP